uniref:Fringe glycosyltransferase n=1 Tax=Steinernema glaseri TaxID=37863 RepID=A0A1I8AM88_9BILA
MSHAFSVVLSDPLALSVSDHQLGVPLTSVDRFHSHFEDIALIGQHEIHSQVSLSAGSYDARRPNLVNVPIAFPTGKDKQRFRSLHCFLFSKRCPDFR